MHIAHSGKGTAESPVVRSRDRCLYAVRRHSKAGLITRRRGTSSAEIPITRWHFRCSGASRDECDVYPCERSRSSLRQSTTCARFALGNHADYHDFVGGKADSSALRHNRDQHGGVIALIVAAVGISFIVTGVKRTSFRGWFVGPATAHLIDSCVGGTASVLGKITVMTPP